MSTSRTLVSLRNAYRLIGYTSKRNCDHIDTRHIWADELTNLASQIAATIENIGGRIVAGAGGMEVNGTVKIVFRIARWILGEKEQYSWRWIIHRRRVPDGLIVVIRLGENNSSILDYLLVPTADSDGDAIRFAEKHRGRLGMERFETSDALVRSVSRRLTKPGHASPTKPAQSTKRSGRSKRTSRCAHA